jgi:hypothetical protein
VSIDRFDGAHVAKYALVDRWTAHYTDELYGLLADLGWLSPPSTAPALAAGLFSAVEGANTEVLDRAVVLIEGDLWAVSATISNVIVKDRRTRLHAERTERP